MHAYIVIQFAKDRFHEHVQRVYVITAIPYVTSTYDVGVNSSVCKYISEKLQISMRCSKLHVAGTVELLNFQVLYVMNVFVRCRL